VWVALVLAVAQWRAAAVGVLLVALLTSAVTTRGRRLPGVLAAAGAVGAALAALRLWDGTGPTWADGTFRNGALAASAVAAYLAGRGAAAPFRGDRHAVRVGVFLVLVVVACGRLAGQTVSLSTLDVRAAYHLAARPATAPLAVLLVIAVHALPVLALTAGLWRARETLPTAAFGAVAAGAGAILLGQLLYMSTVLAFAAEVRPAALALDGLLRVAAEGLYVSMAFAALCLVGRRGWGGNTTVARPLDP
jgi:hypothetical protein